MEAFWRGYVCKDGKELHEVEIIFDGEELNARCTCPRCSNGYVCRHIWQCVSDPPISDLLGNYPLKVSRLHKQ